jgi:hypothetical protein
MPQSSDTHIQTTAQRIQAFVPLALEQRTHVDTASAAYHLGRKAQTMRVWASTETGPVRPLRVNGRLAWPVAEIRAVLQLSAPIAVRRD